MHHLFLLIGSGWLAVAFIAGVCLTIAALWLIARAIKIPKHYGEREDVITPNRYTQLNKPFSEEEIA